MNTVLDALARRVPNSEERIGRLRSFGRTLKRFGRRAGRVTASAAPTVVPFFVQAIAPDTDPETLKLAGTVTEAVAKQVSPLLDDPTPRPADRAGTASEDPITDVSEFRAEFKKLIEDADPPIAAVIVFVDDLDRCLPETVVDTFEAIRLFPNTPRTAYVLALNQGVVESAIDSRYPDLERDGGGIGRDYLEKMLQLKIVIPALSAPEAETYANLLFAEFHLDEPTFDTVVEHAATNRAANGLAVAFNAGIAGTLLGDITEDLARDLAWAANIMPPPAEAWNSSCPSWPSSWCSKISTTPTFRKCSTGRWPPTDRHPNWLKPRTTPATSPLSPRPPKRPPKLARSDV
jgi:hypothetical protein